MSLSFSLNLSGGLLPRLQPIDSLSADDADSESMPELSQEEFSFTSEVTFTEANPKYQEILKLDRILTIAGIPHETTRLIDGWKVAYTPDGEEVSDVAEHLASYGTEDDLLEIRGLDYLIKVTPAKVFHVPEVYGGLNALEVFVFWSQNYRKSNPNYKKGGFLMAWRELLKASPNSRDYKLLRGCYYLSRVGTEKLTTDTLEYLSGAELTELAVMAVLFGDTEFVTVLTRYQTRKHLLGYILDELIEIAINQKNHDIQLMLTDYKYQHHLFRENKFDL